MNLIFLILSLLVITAITVGLMYFFFQLVVNHHPNKEKVIRDLRKMESEIKPWISDLVPWNREELELLSLNQVRKTVQKGIVKTVKGIFTSIYDEPMIVYSYRKYRAAQQNAVLYARTSHRQFIYRFLNNKTTITIDNQMVGTLTSEGQLITSNGKQLLAEIKRNVDALTLPVLVNGKDVAGLLRPIDSSSMVNARAFEYTTELAKGDEALVLSLAILEMLKVEVREMDEK